MRLVTLAQLRADSKLLANQRSTAFMGDAEWDRLINLALTDLYDLFIAERGHEYFEKVANLATSAGSAIVALPADHYQTITILANWGAQQLEELDSLDHLGDQVGFRNWNSWEQFSPKTWRLRGQLIEFFPTPSRVTQLELRYIPTFQDLSGDSATFDDVNGWSRMVTARVAFEALTLQNMPATGQLAIYDRERERIEGLAAERASANAPTIRDVNGGGSDRWWRRLPWPTAST